MAALMHVEMSTAQKELELIEKIFNTRKKHSKNKTSTLKKKLVFSIEKTLDITQIAEVKWETKKKNNQPLKCTINETSEQNEAETLEKDSSLSESDCFVVARHT